MALPLRVGTAFLQRRINGAPLWRHKNANTSTVQLSNQFSHRNLHADALNAHRNPVDILNSSQTKLVDEYIDTLLDWNQRMNLTSVSDKKEAMERHVGDSLALLPIIEEYSSSSLAEGKLNVVDIGSGAGLPGIILGIARPSWEVTLIESTQKKCDFLEDALRVTGLTNVKVSRARAEEKGRDEEFRESFNVAVARAVAEMRVLAELCLPFVSVGGIMVAAKGADPQEEVANAEEAIRLLGGSLLSISEVASQSPHGSRTAIVCLKTTSTPEKYPRRPGMPSKRPLRNPK